MKRLFLIFVLSLTCQAGFSQESEGGRIMSDSTWITGDRVDVPSWVFLPQNKGSYIAVSDPCLSAEVGESQALMRAWFLALADKSLKVQIVTEIFNYTDLGEFVDTSLDDFSLMLRFIPASRDISFTIDECWTSIFGETFVRVTEVTDSESSDISFLSHLSSPIIGEYVYRGGDGVSARNLVRSELTINGISNESSVSHDIYFLKFGSQKNFQLIRSINNQEVDNHERGRFWYNDSQNFLEERYGLDYKGEDLRDGVWLSFYNEMVNQLVNFVDYPFVVKIVEESYQDKVRQITRSSYSGDVSVSLDGVCLKDNHFRADFNIELLGN